MKKSTRFVMLLALVALASATTPRTSESSCLKPACLIGPGCCVNSDCDKYCTDTYGPGTLAYCGGGGTGGCCTCEVIQ